MSEINIARAGQDRRFGSDEMRSGCSTVAKFTVLDKVAGPHSEKLRSNS